MKTIINNISNIHNDFIVPKVSKPAQGSAYCFLLGMWQPMSHYIKDRILGELFTLKNINWGNGLCNPNGIHYEILMPVEQGDETDTQN